MLVHAESCLPYEACGLLAVDDLGAIRMAYPLTNADLSSNRFTIAPDEQYGAVTHADARGWEIGGVFHSHPSGPAVPSTIDLTHPHDPIWFHLIAGFDPTAHIRAWKIKDSRATEVHVVCPPHRSLGHTPR